MSSLTAGSGEQFIGLLGVRKTEEKHEAHLLL